MNEILITKNNDTSNKGINLQELTGARDSTTGILNPIISQKISLEEAVIVSKWIIEENKKRKHMIEKTPKEIMDEVNSGLGYIAKINGEIVGCVCMIEMTLPNGQKIYEAGSLISSPEKRGLGIGKSLAQAIFGDQEKAVYSITEVDSVKHIYGVILGLNQFSKDGVQKEILEKIEEVGALLETDIIYGNKKFLELNNLLKG